jgi:hypothetical protein
MLAAVEADIPRQVDLARQARQNVGLGTSGPDGGCLAETADGTRTESGWEDLGRAGITQATAEVQRIGQEMGYTFPAHNFDDTPGHYYAAHAEKQANALRPGEPIGVSIEMCFDCFNYFRIRAQTMGRPLVVADPWVTRIFRPDGRVEVASRAPAPPATGPTVQNAQPPGP